MGNTERKKGNIQKKVITSILLMGIIPGMLVVILTYLSGINALKNSIGANFQEIAKETADKIQIIMDREIRDAQTLALSPYIRDAVLKANVSVRKSFNNNLIAYLKEYQGKGMREYASILLTDERGTVIAATNKIADYSQSGENWWRTTFNERKGKVFISGINYEEDTQTYSISISVPVMDQDKVAVGVLKMIYDVKDIFKAITNISIGETGHANLVTSDGTLVVCPIFPPKSHRINEQLMRQISSDTPGWGVAADDAHGGENSIIGFAPVISTLQMGPDNFGGKAWYIFVRQLPKETYAPIYALLWEVSFLGLAFIAVLFPLGFYAARKIVRPIGLLTEGAKLIGQGHLDHRMSIKTDDEIEQLAETFNQMADNLEKSRVEREDYLRQLKESEEEYKTFFDHAEDSMLMLNIKETIVAVNKRQEEVIGYPKYDLVGQRFSLILSEKDKETFSDLFERALRGEKPPTAEVEVLSNGQGLLTMEMDLTGIKKEEKATFVQAHLRDITKRKILEKEIMLERNKLETIIESMGDGLDIVDKDFKIQFMNKKFLRLFGKEAIGRKCYEVYMVRNGPCDECPVVKGIEKTGVLEVNTVHGQTLLITHSPFKNLDGTVSILEIFKDITERKKLESTIKESEEQYRTLFDYAEDSMLMVNPDGRVIAVNKRQEEVIGYSRDAISGQSFSLLLADDKDRSTFADLFERIINGEKPSTVEVRVLGRGQILLTMEMDLTSIKRDERTVFVLVHLRDITKRKELEQQLLKIERLNALSHFSSTLAHDLRNPIIGIRKRLESLRSTIEVSPPEKVQRILNDLITGSGLLLGMVNDVLDVYRNSYEELPLIVSTFPIIEAIEEAIQLLQIEAEEKRIRVTINSEHNSLAINGDKRRLQRVFINLLDNAIKHSPLDSKVEITFKAVAEGGAGYLLFKIEDEGPGIPPSELLRIFEPLYRKDGRSKGNTGTGLGLYFCKVVIDAHHGAIWAENGEGKGAVFYIRIPLGDREDAN